MKLSYSNSNLDKKIAEIKSLIKLSMNGVIADQMKENGIKYRQNFGVSIPRLKEIAQAYEPDVDLASRLWFLDIRETRILAGLLQPVTKFEKSTALEWIDQFDQPEIIEQTCMNLLSKLPYSKELSFECIASLSDKMQVTGFTLIARNYTHYTTEEVVTITNRIPDVSLTDNYQLCKAVGLCLSRLVRNNTGQKELIENLLQKLNNNTEEVQIIKQLVEQELIFFYGE